MNVSKADLPPMLRELTLDTWEQTFAFYIIVTVMLLLGYKLHRYNTARKPVVTGPADANLPSSIPAETYTAYIPDKQYDNTAELKEELLATGRELELVYTENERLSSLLLQALEHVPINACIDDTGSWQADTLSKQLFLSASGRAIFGIDANETISFDDILRLIDIDYLEEVKQTIAYAATTGEYHIKHIKIHPRDGSRPRWIRSRGKVLINDRGDITAIKGNLILSHVED